MGRSYRKITLELVVRATATAKVKSELIESVNLVAADHVVYQSAISDECTKRPSNAADYDLE